MSEQLIQEATDQEMQARREQLIEAGVICPGNKINTLNEMSPSETREFFVARGTIQPVERRADGSVSYCALPPPRKNLSTNSEEGEYCLQPLRTENDYLRRKQVYFRSLQELLFARRDLNLIVGRKDINDPEWYF
jgi:hypothetical protein